MKHIPVPFLLLRSGSKGAVCRFRFLTTRYSSKPFQRIDAVQPLNGFGALFVVCGKISFKILVNPRNEIFCADNSASSSTYPASAVREIEP